MGETLNGQHPKERSVAIVELVRDLMMRGVDRPGAGAGSVEVVVALVDAAQWEWERAIDQVGDLKER